MNIFFEIHKNLPREGPGSNECTQKAYSYLKELPPEPSILDIGCGPGAQTIELAKRTNGKIVALDNHVPFLEQLNHQVKREGIENKVNIIEGSMFDMPFDKETFDVVWSEGAIFIIGFKKGLQEWRKFLKRDGYIVVSELSWLRSDPSKQLSQYWDRVFPEMKTVENNFNIIKCLGFKSVGHFVVPESGWWDEYYTPMGKRIVELREKYKEDSEANKTLDEAQLEIEMYRNYSDYYGNVFYIMQNRALR
jgi:ubiquinone/menaquinone biosynthesis C-methylase UbiE